MDGLRARFRTLCRVPLVFAMVTATSWWLAIPAFAGASGGNPSAGALSPLASPFNCVSEEEFPVVEGCGTLVPSGLNNAEEVQVSPDGSNAYSVAVDGALIEYSRNPASGGLAVIGCVSAATRPCAPSHVVLEADAMGSPAGLAISPDGKSVYVITHGSNNAIVEFSRNPEGGLLTETGCVSEERLAGCNAAAGGLSSPYGVIVTPDGRNVYVASYSDNAVAEFARNTQTGELTQLPWPNNCVSSTWASGCGAVIWGRELDRADALAVSPHGGNVYVATGGAAGGGALVAFWRDRENGALAILRGSDACVSEVLVECTPGRYIDGLEDLVVSPDGRNVYASSFVDNAVVELNRGRWGELMQSDDPDACVMNQPVAPGCTAASFIGAPTGVAISTDGDNLYVSSSSQAAEAAFVRDPATGALEQLTAPYGCVTSEPSVCGLSALTGLNGARGTVVSPDGTNVYVAGQDAHAIVELARVVVPSVSSISPPSGSEAGGTTVTVTGSGFADGDAVSFGAKAALNATVNSASSITATSPPGSGVNLDVTVTSPAGTSMSAPGDRFTYTAALQPTVTAISPAGGPETGGTVVSITGSEFVPGATVYFGANEASNVTVDSASLITATTPAGSGTVDVTVRTPSGASPSSAADRFSYPQPEVESPIKGVIGSTLASSPASSRVPAPILGETAIVAPVTGAVRIRLPGAASFVPLSSVRQIPFGTVIDTTHGRAALTTAAAHERTQTSEFYAGELIPSQQRSGLAVAKLTGGNFSVCPGRGRAGGLRLAQASSGHASGSHVVRKLWANAHGSFSTQGNYAAGAVQGTEWLTEDLCEGTLIKVTRDKVEVTDLVRHRHLVVRAGHHYLAHA
jgi:DNA-binding beta-propeller fold protein YncE